MKLTEEGLYVAKIIGQRVNESALRKTPFCALHIEVYGRVDLINPTEPPEKIPPIRRTIELWITENTVERAIRDLKNIGWTGKSFGEFDEQVPKFVDVRGKKIFVSCRHEDNDANARERWSITTAPKPVNRDRLSELDSRFGSLLTDTASPGEEEDEEEKTGDETGADESAG